MADASSEAKPNVTVLGEEIGARKRRRRAYLGGGRSDVVFGMLLLFAGLVLFANTLGLISWDFWHVISRFWPLVLILIGAQIVFGRGTLGWFFIFFVSLAALAFVAAYGLVATHSPVVPWFPPELLRSIEWFNQLTNAYL